MSRNISKYRNIKLGDQVTFKNIFATLNGTITRIHSFGGDCVGVFIKRIDSTGLYSTYEVPYRDILGESNES